MTTKIKLNDVLHLAEEELKRYKLHLAAYNGKTQPLDVFVSNQEEWKEWNEYRDGKDVWNREYIFSLIPDYNKQNRYVFGGIYRIIERLNDWKKTNKGYVVEADKIFYPFVGRLIVEFHRYKGLRGRNFLFEKYVNDMYVAEITEMPYIGVSFPGYENVNIPFGFLEVIFNHQKPDWHTSLENVKGVYLISDIHTGRIYVGSAYGDGGIWSRWGDYVCSGHGGNDELIKVIEKEGIEYARRYFQFSILEIFQMRTETEHIISRENFWKKVLLTRSAYGYNKN